MRSQKVQFWWVFVFWLIGGGYIERQNELLAVEYAHSISQSKGGQPAVGRFHTGLELSRLMGRGINLGNTFDAIGNVWMPHHQGRTKAIIDFYVSKGFKNIRIPVTWLEDHVDGTLARHDGTLKTYHHRFKDLVATVDYALAKGLYVILDTHHEHWLKANYDGSDWYRNKFRALWTNIAEYFADYPPELVFEVLNEPEGRFGDYGQSQGMAPDDPTALAWTREINEVGYQAIRAVDGHQRRVIMVAPNGQGNQGQIADVYPQRSDLPGGGYDPYLMVTVHTYDPWDFAGQDGRNSYYGSELERMRRDIRNGIQNVINWAHGKSVGVYYGEYGVGRRNDQNQRNTRLVREYYRYLTRMVINQNWSTGVWDDGGWFRLIQRGKTGYYSPFGLVDAIFDR